MKPSSALHALSAASMMHTALHACHQVRTDGNDDSLVELAAQNALAIGAGHSFIIFLDGGFPISVLNAIKAVPEVRSQACWTAGCGTRLRAGVQSCMYACVHMNASRGGRRQQEGNVGLHAHPP